MTQKSSEQMGPKRRVCKLMGNQGGSLESRLLQGYVFLFPDMGSCYCHCNKAAFKRGQSLTPGRFLCGYSPSRGGLAGVSPGEH